MEQVRQDAQVKSNTKDHTLYTCRTVTDRTCQKGALQPSGHARTQAVLWVPTFALQCCGRHQLPYQKNTVRLPHMSLGINSVAGIDICHTERRRRNLPHASDNNSVVGAYHHLVPDGMGNKT